MKRLCKKCLVKHVLNFDSINESKIKLAFKNSNNIMLSVYISVVSYIIICYYDPTKLVKPYETCVV